MFNNLHKEATFALKVFTLLCLLFLSALAPSFLVEMKTNKTLSHRTTNNESISTQVFKNIFTKKK